MPHSGAQKTAHRLLFTLRVLYTPCKGFAMTRTVKKRRSLVMQERICGYRALLHRPHRTCEIPLHTDFPNGCRPGMGGRISNELCAFPFHNAAPL